MTDPSNPERGSFPPGRDKPSKLDASSFAPPLRGADSLAFVMDVPVELTIELGRKNVKIGEVLKLGPGSVLELDKTNGDPLDVYVNNRLVARGEAVVVGERYGIRLIEVLVGDEASGSKP
ncbi:MAG TPA: flagellar motor switch protein FliN [Polyangiaceae bacterium]|nr:flagellar motor switch protein FliN [Polyangiaceae bacterium]